MADSSQAYPLSARPSQMEAQPPIWLEAPLFFLNTFHYVLMLNRLLYQAVASIFWEGRRGRKLTWRHVLLQIYTVSVEALPLTALLGALIGALLMHQASVVLPLYGFPDYAEWLTGLILFGEITPLTVALIVIARSANSTVVEIGNMKISGELHALEVLGINIDRYILLPRIIGMTVSVVLLTICFTAAALWGGFWLAEVSELLESNFLLESLQANFTRGMLGNIVLRAFCFGLVIGTVSCLHGLRVRASPTEVPQQARRCVVRALSLCFVINFAIVVY